MANINILSITKLEVRDNYAYKKHSGLSLMKKLVFGEPGVQDKRIIDDEETIIGLPLKELGPA